MRDSADSYDPAFGRVRKTNAKRRNRLDDEETFAKRNRHVQRLASEDAVADRTDGLADDERWSTWDQSTPTERGPRPHPRWLVTDLAAIDTELGIVKTGKEADVFLLRRAVPATDQRPRARPACWPRSGTATRSTGCSTGTRATSRAGGPGTRGSRGPPPTEPRSAGRRSPGCGRTPSSPRSAGCTRRECRSPTRCRSPAPRCCLSSSATPTGRPRRGWRRRGRTTRELADLWDQLVAALVTLARGGFAHGDLSPYNLLVHAGALVMIDLPQVVDVIAASGRARFPRAGREERRRLVRRQGAAGGRPGKADGPPR